MLREILSTLIVILSLTLSYGNATGKLYMRLNHFDNPKGWGANNEICEGKNMFKFIVKNECDHFFDICINSPGKSSYCDLGAIETPHTKNRRTITFGNKIGSMDNPLQFAFKKKTFDLEIKIFDFDTHGRNDRVGSFMKRVRLLSVGKNGIKPSPLRLRLTKEGKNRLFFDFSLWAVCDKNYYGESCEVRCIPQNSTNSGHYSCHPESGKRICFKGYVGEKCLKKDFCSSNPCKNNAACINTAKSFACKCPVGFSGRFCQEKQDPCKTRKACKNGGRCYTSKYGPLCNCAAGFYGYSCENDVDECSLLPVCQNGGTCVNTFGSFKCKCKRGFIGQYCGGIVDTPRIEVAPSHELRKLQISKEPNWPYYVAAGAGLVAVICIALLVTTYQRRRNLKKKRNGQAIVYRAASQRPCAEENVYIGDNESEGTLYEDIDRQLEAAEAGEIDECCPENDFANISYGISYGGETREANKEIKK